MDPPSERGARPVRVARKPGPDASRPVRRVARAPPPPPPAEPPRTGPSDEGPERRANRAATQRAFRLTLLYVVGIAAVYGVLAVFARAGPAGTSAATATDLTEIGLVAVALAGVGTVVALGSAPRAVEVGEEETIIVGRFGRRYRFPGRARLRATVLQRFPAGPLTPAAVASVEIVGGSSRRSFLIDEQLLEGALPSPEGAGVPPD